MLPGVDTPDYTPYVDREKVGIVEAKAHGALPGAEAQSARYASGADRPEVRDARPQPELRYRFESNGHKTYFTDSSDPVSASVPHRSVRCLWRCRCWTNRGRGAGPCHQALDASFAKINQWGAVLDCDRFRQEVRLCQFPNVRPRTSTAALCRPPPPRRPARRSRVARAIALGQNMSSCRPNWPPDAPKRSRRVCLERSLRQKSDRHGRFWHHHGPNAIALPEWPLALDKPSTSSIR